MAPEDPMRGQRWARGLLLLSVIVTVLLYVVPYGRVIGYPLMLLSTFAHEMGHGLAAVVSGADFDTMKLYADGSGVASYSGSGGRLSQAFVSAGGLVGPSLLAALLFALCVRPRRARVGLFALGAGLVLAGVLVVRNPFGFGFVAVAGLLALVLALRAPPRAAQGACGFAAVQLALSVFSRGDYLFTAVAETQAGPAPSDVAQMAEALLLPYWFWGALCGAVSIFVLILGLWLFWRGTRATVGRLELSEEMRA